MDIQILIDQFYDYSKYIKGLSKDTLKNYRDVIPYFCRSIEISDVKDITEKNVRQFFINGRMQRQWKPKTFISYHNVLLIFFRYCIDQGYMTENFINSIECPKIPTNEALLLLEIIMNYWDVIFHSYYLC